MVVTLSPDLAAAITEVSRRLGIEPEELANTALRERFLAGPFPIQPRDEWERRLLGLAKDCGVSPSDEALGREDLYE